MSTGWVVLNIVVWSTVAVCALISRRWNRRDIARLEKEIASRGSPYDRRRA